MSHLTAPNVEPFEGEGPDVWEDNLDGKLVRQGGACVWQASLDATETLDLSQATIEGTTFKFQDRSLFGPPSSADEYVVCWPPSATCSGSAASCFAIGLEGCSYQDGCDQNLHSLLSLNDDACEGIATNCSALSDEFDCHRQRGCTWQ